MSTLTVNKHLRGMITETQRVLKLGLFIETGTYRGESARWAATIFPKVYTIEIDKDMHEAVRKNRPDNMYLILGDSKVELPKLVKVIHEPALFWIDAHFGTSRPPVLEEISCIIASPFDHIMYVDDTLLYDNNKSYSDWPGTPELESALDGYALSRIGGALVAYPECHRELLERIAKDQGGVVKGG